MKSDPTLLEIGRMTDEEARAYLEDVRWPDGAACPHCGGLKPTRLQGKAHRAGVWKCKEKGCRRQFTVTVGTIFHRSKIALRDWLAAFHIVCASKKGVSALQLQRMLKLGSYQTAWFMAHRIRHAMAHDPLRGLLRGVVEADETYVGGKPRPVAGRKHGRTYAPPKMPVVVLVERGGRAHAQYMPKVTSRNLREAFYGNVSPTANIQTDELGLYKLIGRRWPGGHRYVRHASEYVSQDGTHCNSAESFFALFKRGVIGAYHHLGRGHIQKYAKEFEFRWNHKKETDEFRTRMALAQGDGVRLTYDARRA
jgi:transposase-like protein